jgi:biotin carboxyl carrier protein
MDIRKLKVSVGDKTYEVTVEILDGKGTFAPASTPAAAPVASASVQPPPSAAPAQPASSAPSGPGDVVSPLAGKVVSIAKPGDSVNEGDEVATIEAMKMNTYVYAPRSGRVEAVFAQVGDGVEDGKLLLRIN